MIQTLVAIAAFASCALTLPCVAGVADQPTQIAPAAQVNQAKAEQAPQPSWAELAALYGKKLDNAQVSDFFKKYHLGEVDRNANAGIYEPKDCAYAVCLMGGEVGLIILQLKEHPKERDLDYATYSRDLPCGLAPSDTRKDVVRKLGPSLSRNSWISQGLRLDFCFFQDETSPCGSLYITQKAGNKPSQ